MDNECTVQLAALNRPIYPGMLYDCRDHSFLPGVTLWNKKTLESNLVKIQQESAEINIVLSDSKDDREKSLNITADLSLSLATGLINVNGAAHYINVKNSKSNTARVSLEYKTKAHSVFLSMDQLGHMQPEYKSVLEKGMATHVCAGVEYGLDVFFIFERDGTDAKNVQELTGDLNAAVKQLEFAVEGLSADVGYTDTNKKSSEEVNCKYIGDYIPETIPISFKECMLCLQKLPANLKAAGTSLLTAKIIHLYPLSKLDKGKPMFTHSIGAITISRVKEIIQGYENLNDEIESFDQETVQGTPFLKNELKKIQEMSEIASEIFLSKIKPLLPEIRGGKKEDADLLTIIEKTQESPYSPNTLRQYLKPLTDKVACIKLVTDYVSKSNSGVDIRNKIGKSSISYLKPNETAVAFTFNEKAFRCPALNSLYESFKKEDWKDPSKTTSEDQKTTSDDFESNSKKDIQDFYSELKKLNDLLIHFVEYAKEQKAKKFIVNSDDLECSDDNAICIAYTALLTWYDAEPFTLPSTPPKGDINNFVF